jgi:hypothetical protein
MSSATLVRILLGSALTLFAGSLVAAPAAVLEKSRLVKRRSACTSGRVDRMGVRTSNAT